MSGPEALQSVQFVTVKGKRLAVLSADDWEVLVGWLRQLGDGNFEKWLDKEDELNASANIKLAEELNGATLTSLIEKFRPENLKLSLSQRDLDDLDDE